MTRGSAWGGGMHPGGLHAGGSAYRGERGIQGGLQPAGGGLTLGAVGSASKGVRQTSWFLLGGGRQGESWADPPIMTSNGSHCSGRYAS